MGQPGAKGKVKLPAPKQPTPEEVEAQRKKELDDAAAAGREAARMFKETKDRKYGILSNPYMPPRFAERAAWDSAHCQETGSDGMDVSAHLKRTEKPKGKPGRPKKDKGEDKGGE
jgi:hypothetical protein